MKKIRVAFFADTLRENIDGAVRTMYHLINRIPGDRFEFHFIVGEAPEGDFGHKLTKVPTLRIPFNNTYRIAISRFSEPYLDDVLAKFDPHVVHIATPSMLGQYALRYAEQYRLPVLTIYHTHFISYVDYYLRKLPFLIEGSKNLLISYMQDFYNRCDSIYVPGPSMMEELRSIGVFSQNMILWPRGLDSDIFKPDKIIPGYFSGRIPEDRVKILYASRLVWEKNLQTLIEVYRKIEDRNLPYSIIIAGDGYARQSLEQAMPNALFLGHLDQENLSRVYASSDVFLFPSNTETYGNVVAEAMACGLPCVIAKGGGTNDFVSHNKTGFICEHTDSEAYLDAISTLDENKALRERIIRNALNKISDLSWDKLANRYFEDLEKLDFHSSIKAA